MLPLPLIRQTLAEADELGIRSVQLSGGEPFLYPEIVEVLKFASGKKFALTVSTNATLIDEDAVELLTVANAHVVTSIDGPPDYHDTFRGERGSFMKAEKGIARLNKRGIPVKVVTTVCEDNVKHIKWCADWASKTNIGTLQIQPLENIGRGKNIENKRLQEEHLHDLFILVNDLAAFYAPNGLDIKMSYRSRDYMKIHPCTAFVCNGKGCHRGVQKELKKIVIREDGTILPELVDIDRQFLIGNLYNDTLKNNLLNYLKEGYARFDQLCRDVFNDTVLNNPAPLIPWNEILTERSRTFKFMN